MYRIVLSVNGSRYELSVPADKTLVKVLREDLGLTGTKEGCSCGECGACTVLIDGMPVRSCLTLAVDAAGKEIVTIEGLTRNGELHTLQRSFIVNGAIQCGFCTPGMILSAKALLDLNPRPSREEVKNWLSGNLCRCTGYVKIVNAVMAAAGM